jgi:glycosyltransferase involved in cell wall biosynthesis
MRGDQTPAVSIVLATHNRQALLRLAIESVLAQTFTDWELVIADDGSDESTRDYLRKLECPPRIRVLWLGHCGNPGAVRNAALEEARGSLVAFMDSDDLWLPHKLTRQVAALRAAPDRRWSYSAYDCVDEGGSGIAIRWKPYDGEIFAPLLRIEAMVALPTVLAERSLLVEAGGFDIAQRQAEDYELWLRLILRAPVLLVDEPLVRVRRHCQHYSRGGVWGLQWIRRMYEKMEALVPDEAHRRLVRAARTRNAAMLMRAHAARHDWRELMSIARVTGTFSWSEPFWWRSLATSALRAAIPDRVIRVARRMGQPA